MKNAGRTENTISDEKSLKKLVTPSRKTLLGSPRILCLMASTQVVGVARD